jgi:hypothetical protein
MGNAADFCDQFHAYGFVSDCFVCLACFMHAISVLFVSIAGNMSPLMLVVNQKKY